MVATPHFLHPPIAIAAMTAGLHVMTEKPIAVRTSDADKMIAASRKNKVLLAVMFQRRTNPVWKKAKSIIESGALGNLIRTCLMESHFRPQSYYDSGGWRGTWAGEGGGVMLNQAPHAFDTFLWLGGMPSSVLAKSATRGHKIEVEDVALAILDYPNGAVGTVYTSTYEFPQVNINQFVGDRATLEIRDGVLRLGSSVPRAGEMLANTADPWDIPIDVWTEVTVKDEPHGHRFMTQDFVDAILDGGPLIAPAAEAMQSLELANAIAVSSDLGKEVKLPLKRKLFDDFLAGRIKTSKVKKVAAPDKVVVPRR
jgi:predicted dehydrogenase